MPRGRKPGPVVYKCSRCGEGDENKFYSYSRTCCKECRRAISLQRYRDVGLTDEQKAAQAARQFEWRKNNPDYYRERAKVDGVSRKELYEQALQRRREAKAAVETSQKRDKEEARLRLVAEREAARLEGKRRHEEKMAYYATTREERRAKEKARKNMKKRIKEMLAGINTSVPRLGFSRAEFVTHMEKQFTKEMTWENYGSYWHIDHIIPLSAFNLDEMDEAWALPNLRPFHAVANIKKADKLLYLL